jgi:hypothetical protein
MPVPAQKSTSNLTLNSNKTNLHNRGPIDLYYMRRLAVKQQKQHVILHNLLDLSVYYFITFALTYFLSILVIFPVQIVIIVRQTPLSFVFSGFWVSIVYGACIASLYILGKFLAYCLKTNTSILSD